MIKSVTITNYLQESVKIELTEPESSGFIIRSIEGLGPAKANINLTELATLDGALDNGALLGTRNIVMSLIFVGTPTIEDTRLKSYKYFPIKQNLTFEIETDNRHCYTVGRVESNNPTIFGDDREGCQISILCPNSYFQDVMSDVIYVDSKDDNFTFPFSNESLTEPLIEFGLIKSLQTAIVPYVGNNETGMILRIYIDGPANNIGIERPDTNEQLILSDDKMQAIIGGTIRTGDEIIISTVKGNKRAYLVRNDRTYNILNALEAPINWIQLYNGDNEFVFTADASQAGLRYEISYQALYEGV